MYGFEDKLNILENYYAKKTNSSLIFLRGEMGLGKSYTLNKFVEGKYNVLHIKPPFCNDYFLMPFLDAVPSIKQLKKDETSYLTEVEKVKSELIRILKQNRHILIFESITTYNIELFSFCNELMKYILSELLETNTFIIAEINSDIILSDKKIELLTKELLSLSFEAQYINYKKISKDVLKKIFIEGFHSNINIKDSDWNYIAESSFGNISWMMLIIGYLKQEEYIYYSQCNTWECLHIPEHELDNIVSKYIYSRYNKLDDNLKIILQKSSLIGPIFGVSHLKQSFELLQANQELKQIEIISDLIHNTDYKNNGMKYVFESQDTHKIIQKMIPQDKQCSWNNILAQYYENIVFTSQKSNVEKFQLFRKIAICNEQAHKFPKAMVYYLKAIHMATNLLDYSQSLTLIFSAKELLCFITNTDEYLYPLYISEAKCYMVLGRYKEELDLYTIILGKCNLNERDYYQILFQKACALYNNDQNSAALKALKEIEIKLPILKDDHFSLNVFREFAAVYYFCRFYEEAGEYFTQALNMCKKGSFKRDYYLLLRQSSMFWELEISQEAQLKALEYFTSQKDIKEKAKVSHNLGTDALWMVNAPFAKIYLYEAKEEFSKFGSSDIHYTYNCLGIYKAVFEKDYTTAILYFKKMEDFKTDLFSKFISIINCASCFCALENFEESDQLVKKYEDMLSELTAVIPPYLLYYYINKGILSEIKGCYKESVYYFSECLKLKLKNEQIYLIGKHLKRIREKNKEVFADYQIIDIDALCAIAHRPLYDMFYDANICLSTLRFWW